MGPSLVAVELVVRLRVMWQVAPAARDLVVEVARGQSLADWVTV
jgi:hypothetical protein